MPGTPESDRAPCHTFAQHPDVDVTGRVTGGLEPAVSPGFRFHGVHRRAVVGPAARMHDMVGGATDGPAGHLIHQVEGQRGVDGDRRVQRTRRLPGPEPDARDPLPRDTGGAQQDGMAIAGEDEPVVLTAGDPRTCTRSTDEST